MPERPANLGRLEAVFNESPSAPIPAARWYDCHILDHEDEDMMGVIAVAQSLLHGDPRAHDDGAVAGQADVLRGVGGDPRGGDEKSLAPTGHAGLAATRLVDRK